jgi:hypothetical protein
VSDLDWTTGPDVPDLVVATVGVGGPVELTGRADTTDVIVDVVGRCRTPD